MSCSLFPSLCHPRLTLSNIWEKRSWIFLFSLLLGLLLHSVLPPFIKVPKKHNSCRGRHVENDKRGSSATAPPPCFDFQLSAQLSLETAVRLRTLALEALYTIPPNTADHPQLKPTSNSHLLNNFTQNCPGSVPASQEARLSASIVPTQMCRAELNPELTEKPVQNSVATALKERKESFKWGTGLVTHLVSFLYVKLWECGLHKLWVRNWTWDHSSCCSKH